MNHMIHIDIIHFYYIITCTLMCNMYAKLPIRLEIVSDPIYTTYNTEYSKKGEKSRMYNMLYRKYTISIENVLNILRGTMKNQISIHFPNV